MSCNNPSKWGLQQRMLAIFTSFVSCNNPSKWGLQQLNTGRNDYGNSCNNPSKWGLQQPGATVVNDVRVVITPQNGVFNNMIAEGKGNDIVVITPQNGVFNNT